MPSFPDFQIPSTIETPAVCVDSALMDANINRMAAGLREKGIAFRPHVKSHKSLTIARRQISAGAVGLTTATIGEAEVFVNGGIDDVFIAYPLWVTDIKGSRLRALLERARVAVGVSSAEGAERLASGLGSGIGMEVLIEIDSGDKRTGVTDPDMAVRVAAAAARAGLNVKGVFTHGGHSYAGAGAVADAAADEVRTLSKAAAALRAAGHGVEIVSAGSTPTALLSATADVTEERPGTFVFGDRQQAALGAHSPEAVALFVAATVVSVAGDQFVLDAGAKVLTKDLPATVDGFAALPQYPHSRVERLYDHHAVVVRGQGTMPSLGERVAMVPNHVCPVVNLTDELVVLNSSGEEADRWPVDARLTNR